MGRQGNINMGLYDSVRSYHSEIEGGFDYQTKSLEKNMDNYEIRSDGTLWRQMVEYIWIEQVDHPLMGYCKQVSTFWLQKTDVHGTINIYSQKDDTWLEYELTFDRSVLSKVEKLYDRR